MRFSRQRYWGEPFPVYYVNGLQMIDKKHLPIVLPEVEKYLPTEDGQPPLGNATVWAWDTEKMRLANDLIDNVKSFSIRIEHHARVGQVLLGIGCVIWMRKRK